MTQESKATILSKIDTKTKVLALVSLIAEALFLGSLATLPSDQTLYALITCAAILIITIIGIVIVEVVETRRPDKGERMLPSPLTPDSDLLNELINGAIHTVCRAFSLPQTPESAKLRAFIFRKEGNQLVCSHFWSPNPVKEMVRYLRFEINAEIANRVAVVKAVINEEICRTEVEPLPNNLKGVTGQVSKELNFVLAAPIRNDDGSIYGVVDFDAGNEVGKSLLKTDVSDAVMYQLAQHVRVICSLPEREGVLRANQ